MPNFNDDCSLQQMETIKFTKSAMNDQNRHAAMLSMQKA